LSLAIESQNWQAFHLLAKGAIIRTTQSLGCFLWRSAYLSVLQLKAIETLFARGADVAVKRGGNPIGHGALAGLLHDRANTVFPFEDFKSILKKYMEARLDFNATNEANEPLLHVAVAKANKSHESSLTQHLVEVGVDVYQPVYGPWDAFLLAAVHGRLSALRVLIVQAAKEPNSKHWTHLERSDHSAQDVIEIVCASLARNNLINSQNSNRLSLLYKAVELGNTYTASTLPSHSADLQVPDGFGWTALHTATYNKAEAMVRLLLHAGSDVGATTQQWVRDDAIPLSLSRGDMWTGAPLHIAALLGQPAIAELLLRHGADFHADAGSRDSLWAALNCTALQMALYVPIYWSRNDLGAGMLRAAEMLVENQAEVEGVANHINLHDVLRFEGFAGLWEKLRRGITGTGYSCDDGLSCHRLEDHELNLEFNPAGAWPTLQTVLLSYDD
jgi:ankyrin repeat protein